MAENAAKIKGLTETAAAQTESKNKKEKSEKTNREYTEEEVMALLKKQYTLMTQSLEKQKPDNAGTNSARKSRSSTDILKLEMVEHSQKQAKAAFDLTSFEASYMSALIQDDSLSAIQELFNPLLTPEHSQNPMLHLKFSLAINRLLQDTGMESQEQYECLKFLLENLDKMNLVNDLGQSVSKKSVLETLASDNYPPMARAFLSCSALVIRLLLQHQADPFKECLEWKNKNLSPLLMIARRKPEDLKEIFDIKELSELLKTKNANQLPHHHTTSTGFNLFMTAAGFGNIPMMEHLLSLDPSFTAKTCDSKILGYENYDAFMFAASLNAVASLKWLHAKHPDYIKRKNYNALHEAAFYSSPQNSNLDAIKYLIEIGGPAILNSFGGPKNYSVIHHAASGGHVAILHYLLSRGAKLGLIDAAGKDAREAARARHKTHALNFLEGAYRLLALMSSKEMIEDKKIIEERSTLLNKYPANIRNMQGDTLLHLLIANFPITKHSVEELLLILINKGADILAKNDGDDTPLDWIVDATWSEDPLENCRMAWKKVVYCYKAAIEQAEKSGKGVNERIARLKHELELLVIQNETQTQSTREAGNIDEFGVPVFYEALFDIDPHYILLFAKHCRNTPKPQASQYRNSRLLEQVLQFYRENSDKLAHLVLAKQLKCIEKHISLEGKPSLEFELGDMLSKEASLDSTDKAEAEHETEAETKAVSESNTEDDPTIVIHPGMIKTNVETKKQKEESEEELCLRLQYAQQFFLQANNVKLAFTCFLETIDFNQSLFFAETHNRLFQSIPEEGQLPEMLPKLALMIRDKLSARSIAGRTVDSPVSMSTQVSSPSAPLVFSEAATIAQQGISVSQEVSPEVSQETLAANQGMVSVPKSSNNANSPKNLSS